MHNISKVSVITDYILDYEFGWKNSSRFYWPNKL